jgi:coproporphyrinogen III oxidase
LGFLPVWWFQGGIDVGPSMLELRCWNFYVGTLTFEAVLLVWFGIGFGLGYLISTQHTEAECHYLSIQRLNVST